MRGDEEANLIHGLELQGRAVSAVTADTDNISFLVGTQVGYFMMLLSDTGLVM